MSSAICCETCRFWHALFYDTGVPVKNTNPKHRMGECRIRAPRQSEKYDMPVYRAIFPATTEETWCGEFEARP